MFFEDVCRDERQLVNGLSEFRGHALRSDGHEANSGDGGRNLQRAHEWTDFGIPCREFSSGYCEKCQCATPRIVCQICRSHFSPNRFGRIRSTGTTRRAFPWIPPSLAWRNEIVIAAFGVVAFSVVVEGLTMPLLLRLLGFLPKRP
jgi:hypothetical protein